MTTGGALAAGGALTSGGATTAFESPLCIGAAWVSPAQLVLVGVSPSETVFLQANGERIKAAHFVDPPPADSSSFGVSVRGNRVLSWIAGPDSSVPTAVSLFGRDGSEHWALSSRVMRVSASVEGSLPSDVSEPIAVENGLLGNPTGSQPSLIGADGIVHDTPLGSFSALSPPDVDGWIVVQWTSWDPTNNTTYHNGFLSLVSLELREITPMVSKHYFSGPTPFAGRVAYLSDEGGMTLHLATPTNNRAFTLSLNPTESDIFRLFVDDTWVLLDTNGIPSHVLDLSGGEVTRLSPDPASLAGIWLGNLIAHGSGDWFVGMDLTDQPNLVAWRSNVRDRNFLVFDASAFAPLRPIDALSCGKVLTLGDGQIGLGLRDDAAAGWYTGDPSSGQWKRIGLPLTSMGIATAVHVHNSWIIHAETGEASFCTQFKPFEGSPPEALAGNSLQIVAPGANPVTFGEPLPRRVTLDPSGTCAIVEFDSEVRVYDLSAGRVALLSDLRTATWL
jgi:hypothetical protein